MRLLGHVDSLAAKRHCRSTTNVVKELHGCGLPDNCPHSAQRFDPKSKRVETQEIVKPNQGESERGRQKQACTLQQDEMQPE
jgi:hypothetical protein